MKGKKGGGGSELATKVIYLVVISRGLCPGLTRTKTLETFHT